jgi:hypothetical protein
MRVIHDPPYRPTKGKFCIVGGRPVNKGLACCKCLVQNEALNGGRRSPGVAVGGVAELSRRSSGLFHGSGYSDSTIQRIRFGRVPQKCYGPKRSRNGLGGNRSCRVARQSPIPSQNSHRTGNSAARSRRAPILMPGLGAVAANGLPPVRLTPRTPFKSASRRSQWYNHG